MTDPTLAEIDEYGDPSTNAVVPLDPGATFDGDAIFLDEDEDLGLE
jgi:hypothetical protein